MLEVILVLMAMLICGAFLSFVLVLYQQNQRLLRFVMAERNLAAFSLSEKKNMEKSEDFYEKQKKLSEQNRAFDSAYTSGVIDDEQIALLEWTKKNNEPSLFRKFIGGDRQ